MQFFKDDNANVNSCTKIGASPLYGACENEHVDVIQLLLNSKATVKAVMHSNSPLILLVKMDTTEPYRFY